MFLLRCFRFVFFVFLSLSLKCVRQDLIYGIAIFWFARLRVRALPFLPPVSAYPESDCESRRIHIRRNNEGSQIISTDWIRKQQAKHYISYFHFGRFFALNSIHFPAASLRQRQQSILCSRYRVSDRNNANGKQTKNNLQSRLTTCWWTISRTRTNWNISTNFFSLQNCVFWIVFRFDFVIKFIEIDVGNESRDLRDEEWNFQWTPMDKKATNEWLKKQVTKKSVCWTHTFFRLN